ncbi:ABC transporter permease [Carnobacterium divergens]|uniref:Iron ABC transporter permease n=2 Tax=Carnobacterium TaxID=2747 RepID=A0A2R8A175_CARDV|nr:iron chelate uptake ABC transporter family permease subunit [Carnobacterium divergens]MCO6017438.1 iron chelate uptake ABC transporter family permease subunit [Carnobacterium divergens]MDT1939150.1 iron chelate uptake ABC transporter family permease subunit [Carnobacterium divergens]MDT1941588.1 iron chelate uptake ABC transporter family permease subunit [Carnobacterium divergens]MDT1947386.1 iron chelate uptake ABC transporter family permease subunit [Carnobacterium divergens]MDT1949825.1 
MRNGLWMVSVIGLAIASLFIGVESIQLTDLLQLNEQQQLVLLSTRFPRMISLILAGATMSISGLIMQHLTQNKFVSPTTSGTMDSARIGILVAMLVFNDASILQKTGIAFLFAVAGTFIFIGIVNRVRVKSTMMIPLIGMMFGSIMGSIATFLAYQYDLVQNVSSWLQGNFSLVSRGNYELIYLAVPLMIVAYLYADYFTIAGLGKDMATSIGVSYQVVQFGGVLIVSLATAVVILTVGSVPFLGIIIPNLVALMRGDHLKNTLLETALFGSAFLLVCDMISRVVIAPYEVSVSLVVGIIGSALFMYLLMRGESSHEAKKN